MVESNCITGRSSIDQGAARYIRTFPNPNQHIAAMQAAKMPRRNHAAKSHQVIVGDALKRFGLKPDAPIASFVKRLRCTKCGGGSVMAERVPVAAHDERRAS